MTFVKENTSFIKYLWLFIKYNIQYLYQKSSDEIKYIGERKMKVVEENDEKIFTKEIGKDIINTNCSSLKANYKNLFEKDGLVMEKTKEVILYGEKDKLKNNKKFIKLLRKICNDLKIDNYEVEIKKFLENK